MNDVRSEYAKFLALVATQKGWEEIDNLWMVAMNNRKNRKGEWIKRGISDGKKVAGFAFDPVSKMYLLDKPGRSHERAKHELIKQLQEDVDDYVQLIDVEGRVVEGRAAYVGGWKFPLISLQAFWGVDCGNAWEELILEMGIGLPIFAFLERIHEEEKTARKKPTD